MIAVIVFRECAIILKATFPLFTSVSETLNYWTVSDCWKQRIFLFSLARSDTMCDARRECQLYKFNDEMIHPINATSYRGHSLQMLQLADVTASRCHKFIHDKHYKCFRFN